MKDPGANAGDTGLIPGSGRPPRGGNGNPLQYLAWKNPMDRGVWWATAHGGHKESGTTEHAYMERIHILQTRKLL